MFFLKNSFGLVTNSGANEEEAEREDAAGRTREPIVTWLSTEFDSHSHSFCWKNSLPLSISKRYTQRCARQYEHHAIYAVPWRQFDQLLVKCLPACWGGAMKSINIYCHLTVIFKDDLSHFEKKQFERMTLTWGYIKEDFPKREWRSMVQSEIVR